MGGGAAGVSAMTLNYPCGMVLDTNSNLYLADQLNNRVLFFPADSTVPSRVYGQNSFSSGVSNGGGAITSGTLSQPAGVALDASGRLYVADSGNNRVVMFP
jgi:hypothetical protein